MRSALDGDHGEVLDQGGDPSRGGRVGRDPVGVAVDEQRGDVDPAQVLAEVLSQASTQSCPARAETASAIEKAQACSLIRVPIRRSTLKSTSRRP